MAGGDLISRSGLIEAGEKHSVTDIFPNYMSMTAGEKKAIREYGYFMRDFIRNFPAATREAKTAPEKIVEALRCRSGEPVSCNECPFQADCNEPLFLEAANLIEAQEAQIRLMQQAIDSSTRWISTADAMPGTSVLVLIAAQTEGGTFLLNGLYRFDGGDYFTGSNGVNRERSTITHWMAVPTIPDPTVPEVLEDAQE